MDEQTINNLIKKYLEQQGFTARKISDSPQEAYSLVNRRYVNMSGNTASRPNSSVATLGQFYFDTTDGAPRWWNGTAWVNSSGTPS